MWRRCASVPKMSARLRPKRSANGRTAGRMTKRPASSAASTDQRRRDRNPGAQQIDQDEDAAARLGEGLDAIVQVGAVDRAVAKEGHADGARWTERCEQRDTDAPLRPRWGANPRVRRSSGYDIGLEQIPVKWNRFTAPVTRKCHLRDEACGARASPPARPRGRGEPVFAHRKSAQFGKVWIPASAGMSGGGFAFNRPGFRPARRQAPPGFF